MTDRTHEAGPVTFDPPAPGAWELEATHHGRRPLSPFLRDTYKSSGEAGFRTLTARYGLPLAGIRLEYVNGCTYMRPTAIGEGAKPKPPPPMPVMKLIARLHPEMRRRNRSAAAAWRSKRWRREVDDWFTHERASVVEQNLAFQAVDVRALDDEDLLAHMQHVLAHFAEQARLNLANHGGDLIPAGDYLAHCQGWGVSHADAAALLRGSSPASIETAQLLAPAADAIAAAPSLPTSTADVRALGTDASRAVDAWLEHHGWRLVTTDDIDRPTLAERPTLQLAALLAAPTSGAQLTESPDPAPVRDLVPPEDRGLFDELLEEARYGMRQRDDVVGVRWNWSAGLLRRAVLELGRRLTDLGRIHRPDHAVELTPEEIGALLLDGREPDGDEVERRASRRDQVEAAGPPELLGEPEDPPPLDAFPAPMARATAAVLAVLEAEGLSAGASSGPLAGAGVGTETYRGPARVVSDADDALERLRPGDVLVAPFTGPAYNSIVPILGALIVDSGGPMCHAAIVAREFHLPAVIGATGATAQIPDGALVEVDPVKGTVQVVATESGAPPP